MDSYLDFYVDTDHASSSLIQPKNHTSVVRVETRRLDSFLELTNIFLLKVEAEGAEPEVLLAFEN